MTIPPDLPTRVAALEAAVAELRAGVVRGPDAGMVRVPLGSGDASVPMASVSTSPAYSMSGLATPTGSLSITSRPMMLDGRTRAPIAWLSPEPWPAVAARAHQTLAEAAGQVADAAVCLSGGPETRQEAGEAPQDVASEGRDAPRASGALSGPGNGMSSDNEAWARDRELIEHLRAVRDKQAVQWEETHRALLSERANVALMQSRLEDASAAVERHIRREADLHEALSAILAICGETHAGQVRAHAALSRIQDLVWGVVR